MVVVCEKIVMTEEFVRIELPDTSASGLDVGKIVLQIASSYGIASLIVLTSTHVDVPTIYGLRMENQIKRTIAVRQGQTVSEG